LGWSVPSRTTACVSRCSSTACSETSVETEVGHTAEGPGEPQPVPRAVPRRGQLRPADSREARMAAARGTRHGPAANPLQSPECRDDHKSMAASQHQRSSPGRLPRCGWFGDPCWPSAGSARRSPPVHAVSGPHAGMSIRTLSIALSISRIFRGGWHVVGRSSIADCRT
jgi:hypothetical protein